MPSCRTRRGGFTRRLLIGSAVFVCGLASAIAPSAAAAPLLANCKQTAGHQLAPGCSSLLVSPARVVVPPDVISHGLKQTFTVTDNGSTDYPVDVFVTEYVQDPQGGLTVGQPVTKDEAFGTVQVTPSTLSMRGSADPAGTKSPPGSVSQAKVVVTITPRAGAAPGDHTLAVVFRRPPAPDTHHIEVAPQIATQILIQVPGKATSGVKLSHVRVAARSRMFGMNRPGSSDVSVDVRNTGNIHQDFYNASDIDATISGFGASKGTNLSFPKFTVLRGSTRTVTAKWSHQPLLCLCKVTVTAHISRAAVLTSAPPSPQIAWQPVAGTQDYLVVRNGQVLTQLPAAVHAWTDPQPLSPGTGIYSVVATTASSIATVPYTIIPVWLVFGVIVGLLAIASALVIWRKRRKGRAARLERQRQRIREEERARLQAELAEGGQDNCPGG